MTGNAKPRVDADDTPLRSPDCYVTRGVGWHPAVEHVMKFFVCDHLPEKLQEVSKPFCDLALQLANRAPFNQETTVALRKLLEAKDAAVRSVLS
jgi:thymidine phosphorylase